VAPFAAEAAPRAGRPRPKPGYGALLQALASHRPWLLVGGAVLTGGLLAWMLGATQRRALRRGFTLLVGPAVFGALRAEGQHLVQQLIRSRLFASVADWLRPQHPAPR